jgi:MinD-like ATPase involved in chromosome partitioning or flagellar assembly
MMSALAALAATERGDRVLLVDACEGGGTLHLLFGVRPTQSLWMLTDRRSDPRDVVIPLEEGLTLVAGGTSGTAVAPATDNERRSALARLAHVYPDYDTIIFDGGSRLDTISALSELADPSVLLVTSVDRLALAANYALVKSIASRRDGAAIAVLANRHGESLAEEACDFLIGACSHFLGRTIEIAGAVPDDPCLLAAVGAGMTVRDALDGSPAADAMRGVLSRVLPSSRDVPAPRAMSVAAAPSPTSFRRWS